MRNHGFVLQLSGRLGGPVPALRPVSRDGGRAADGRGFRLFVRPFPTTPESERESQPVMTPHAILVYEGRVDNRADIAGRLGRPELASAADGLVLAEAYRAWGRDLPGKVLGEYSFAAIDRIDGSVLAGVDSLGVRRLFTFEDAGGLWLASDLELLLGELPSLPELAYDGLVDYLAGGSVMSGGRTVYRGVREIDAGQVLVHRDGVWGLSRSWQPDPEAGTVLRSDAEYDEALRSLLLDAVRAALRSNCRVSVDVSGGLDSSTVAAVASTLARSGHGPERGMLAFSYQIAYPPEDNERDYQQALLALHPFPHHVVPMDQHPVFRRLDDDPPVHPHTDVLSGTRLQAVRDLVAAEGCHVAVTGMGGDQAFCGDGFPPVFLAEWRQDGHWAKWIRGVRAWARLGNRSLWNLLWRCSRGPARNKFMGRRVPTLPVWLSTEVRAAVLRRIAWVDERPIYRSSARQLQYQLATCVPRIARFNGLPWEERHPLLYRPLLEFMLAVPWEQKVRPDQDRVLQRRALAGLLPDRIRLRTGKGEGKSLLIDGAREHWPTLARLLDRPRIVDLGLVQLPALRAAAERLRHGLINRHNGFFMAAFSLEAWLRAREAGATTPGRRAGREVSAEAVPA